MFGEFSVLGLFFLINTLLLTLSQKRVLFFLMVVEVGLLTSLFILSSLWGGSTLMLGVCVMSILACESAVGLSILVDSSRGGSKGRVGG